MDNIQLPEEKFAARLEIFEYLFGHVPHLVRVDGRHHEYQGHNVYGPDQLLVHGNITL